MSSEYSQVGLAGVSTSSKSGHRVMLTLLLFVLALMVVGAAVYYVGGVEYVNSLFTQGPGPGSGGSGPAAGAGAAAATAATATAAVSTTELQLPPGVSEELAKRMYVEQIQSQVNLVKMSDGEIKRINVTSVKASKNNAAIFITAYFADDTSAPGVIQLVNASGSWYFRSITGLQSGSEGGDADTVQNGNIGQGKKSDAAVVRQSGITDFDYGVINTFLAEQTANQTLIKGLVDGTYNKIELGKPVGGVGTTTVPSTLSGKSAAAVSGETVLIHTTVDQEDLTFLTAFRTK